jgi:hypothetical protein
VLGWFGEVGEITGFFLVGVGSLLAVVIFDVVGWFVVIVVSGGVELVGLGYSGLCGCLFFI